MDHWTTALIGAVVLWLSGVGGAGRPSPSEPPHAAALTLVAPHKREIEPAPEMATARPLTLARILMSDAHVSTIAGTASQSGEGYASPEIDDAVLAHRLAIHAARRERIETLLPASFVIVNIPQARLWMVRDRVVEGSMRVIVGRPDQPSPVMATELTHLVLNPRWNVPADIVRTKLAPKAARSGGRSLTGAGFEVMSGWRDDSAVVPAAEVDWKAVQAGRLEVPVRQKPGSANAMGSAKFVITNDEGVYLHDTPDRALFRKNNRALSAGCIRVEDYRRLVAFLAPQPLSPGPDPDRPTYVRLGAPMPIYLTYITAVATAEGPVLFPDPYARDGRS